MLINPYEYPTMPTHPGTRVVAMELGVVGMAIQDPWNPNRLWRVQGVYSPLKRRALDGVRVKLEDEKQFIAFCNQRDFEVLIGLGKSGEFCPWTGSEYPTPGDNNWFGLCLDESDLIDDLHDREMAIRTEIPGVLPTGLELKRRLHISRGIDVEELLYLNVDADEQGFGPDPRIETIGRRWVRIERLRTKWKYLTMS